jgi:glyoxylase-like metal-dependent hydrolase (beta-lactamase superfamily II)
MAVDPNKPTYKINILHIGYCGGIGEPLANLAKGMEGIQDFSTPYYSFLITGDNIPPIIVDTGVNEDDLGYFEHLGVGPVILPSELKFESQLQKFGYKFEDIGAIIHTHLHVDHAGNDHRFPNAKIIMARKELMFSVSGFMLRLYPKELIKFFIDQLHTPGKVRLIDENAEIVPGIVLDLTEGHTLGSLMVRVNTTEGLVIMCGDVIYVEEYQVRNHPQNPDVAAQNRYAIESFGDCPTGIYWNVWEATKAVQRVMRDADIVLTQHDPLILEKYGGKKNFTIG